MKVTIDGAVIAEAADDELVKIVGNWYFPPVGRNFAGCVAFDRAFATFS